MRTALFLVTRQPEPQARAIALRVHGRAVSTACVLAGDQRSLNSTDISRHDCQADGASVCTLVRQSVCRGMGFRFSGLRASPSPIEWAPRACCPAIKDMKLTIQFHIVPRLKWSFVASPPYA